MRYRDIIGNIIASTGSMGEQVKIYRNLSDRQIVRLVNRAREKQLRGLVVGEDNYYWDAYDETHSHAAAHIGRGYDADDRFWVHVDDGDVIMGWTERNQYGRDLNAAYLKLMSSPLLLFDGGSMGMVTGQEILAAFAG